MLDEIFGDESPATTARVASAATPSPSTAGQAATPHASPSPAVQRKHHRTVMARELVQSDRVALAVEANRFIGTMVSLRVSPMFASSMNGETELTPVEQATYDSALDYLKRQFFAGARDPEAIQVRVESEATIEFLKGT